MKTMMRGFGLALVAGMTLGFAGCSADNESEADRLQKGVGAAPATTVKGGEAPQQATSLQQYADRHKKETAADPKQSEYGKAVGAAKK